MRHRPPAVGQRILGAASAGTKPPWWGFQAPGRRVPPRDLLFHPAAAYQPRRPKRYIIVSSDVSFRSSFFRFPRRISKYRRWKFADGAKPISASLSHQD